MKKWAYYNEIDPYCADWLRALIRANLIAPGDVDERDIRDVAFDDIRGYDQCHFFAGIGGWSLALRRAAWPDNRKVWTGSCPCQPFSTAGRRRGFSDDRHLWPFWYYLIRVGRPPIVFGEQVAGASDWLRLVRGDLEAVDYAVGAIPVEAASAGADHLRDRYWFVGYDTRQRRGEGWSQPAIRGGRDTAAGHGRASVLAQSDGAIGAYEWSESRGMSSGFANTSVDGALAHDGRGQSERWREPRELGGSPAAQPHEGHQRQWAGNATRDRGEDGVDMAFSFRRGWQQDGRFAAGDTETISGQAPDRLGDARAHGGFSVADRDCQRFEEWPQRDGGALEPGIEAPWWDDVGGRGIDVADAECPNQRRHASNPRSPASAGSSEARAADGNAVDGPREDGGYEWVLGADGKARRVVCRLRVISDGISSCMAGVRSEKEVLNASTVEESVEQCALESADFMRLLPHAESLARLEGDAATEKDLQALRVACEGVWPLSKTLSTLEEIWRSLPDETRQRLWDAHCKGRYMKHPIALLSNKRENRVAQLRAFGNAIDPRPATAFIQAVMESL